MNITGLKAAADSHRRAAATAVDPTDITIAGAQALLAEAHIRRELSRSLRGGTLVGLRVADVPSVRLGASATATNPGMPAVLGLEDQGDAPFPLTRIPARSPAPPAHDAGSLFTRALTWTLKAWRG